MKAALSVLGLAGLAYTQSQTKGKPNFVFIITDDQDSKLNSLTYQPLLQKHLVEQGTIFDSHYCTISICCPSRVSLLTGRAAHNTNVTDVSPPYGGYSKFIKEGWNDKYLPVWLQEVGYNTYYTGKLMNGLSTTSYNAPFPNGWTGTDFFLDPNTYVYYNVTMQRDKEAPRTLTGQYSTDLAADTALSFLDSALAEPEKPFFIGVAPIGPHSETWQGRFNTPVPADRHKDLFPGLQVPRTPSFNPDVPSGGGWIRLLPRQNQTVVDYHDDFYRRRIQTLQAVDELIDRVVTRLPQDVLDNTYIIYTADNGFHIGQHRLAPGKTCGIEEDINVPFVIRGPGVPAGQRWDSPTSHTDIVPTLFQLAGIPLQDDFDGVPMPVTGQQVIAKGEHVNVEFWGSGIQEGDFGSSTGVDTRNNTYKTLRLIGDGYSLSYTVWCSNEHELYDMKADPYQMTNIYPATLSDSTTQISGWDSAKLIPRIDNLLLTLKACKGATCREPWKALHPDGDVLSLRDAMKSDFDDFYEKQQPRVSFTECNPGYLTEFEGPMAAKIFGV